MSKAQYGEVPTSNRDCSRHSLRHSYQYNFFWSPPTQPVSNISGSLTPHTPPDLTPIAPPVFHPSTPLHYLIAPNFSPTCTGAERSDHPPGQSPPPPASTTLRVSMPIFFPNNWHPLCIDKLVHIINTHISEWVSGMMHDNFISIYFSWFK